MELRKYLPDPSNLYDDEEDDWEWDMCYDDLYGYNDGYADEDKIVALLDRAIAGQDA